MMDEHVSTPLTLVEIARRKKAVLNEIREQQETMKNTTRLIFAPVAATTNKVDSVMRSFNTGLAIFDGVMLGIKIMRKFRMYFGKMK